MKKKKKKKRKRRPRARRNKGYGAGLEIELRDVHFLRRCWQEDWNPDPLFIQRAFDDFKLKLQAIPDEMRDDPKVAKIATAFARLLADYEREELIDDASAKRPTACPPADSSSSASVRPHQ